MSTSRNLCGVDAGQYLTHHTAMCLFHVYAVQVKGWRYLNILWNLWMIFCSTIFVTESRS